MSIIKKSLLLSCFILASSPTFAMEEAEGAVSCKPEKWRVRAVLVEKSATVLQDFFLDKEIGKKKRPVVTYSAFWNYPQGAEAPEEEPEERTNDQPFIKLCTVKISENLTKESHDFLEKLRQAIDWSPGERLSITKFTAPLGAKKTSLIASFSKSNSKRIRRARELARSFFDAEGKAVSGVLEIKIPEKAPEMIIKLAGEASEEGFRHKLGNLPAEKIAQHFNERLEKQHEGNVTVGFQRVCDFKTLPMAPTFTEKEDF